VSSRRPPAGRLPVAVLLLPACFIIEVILGGPVGRYGGVSLRFILLGASCVVLLFALLLRGRLAGSHRLAILSILGFLVLNGIWVAFVPVLAGTSLHWAVREPHAFVVLIPVVLTLALLSRDELARTVPWLQRIVVVASLALALFQVGLWVFGTLLGDLKWVTPLILGAIYPGAGDYLTVGVMPDGFFRVFWISTLWCLLGFFWIPVAFPNTPLRWLLRGLLLLDLFVAYSRGIWLGLLAGLLVAYGAILTRRTFGRVLVRAAVVGTLAAAAFVGIAAAVGELERGTARIASTTSSSDASIGVRVEQARYLLQLWYEHPLVGSGYGAYVAGHLRSQEVPYSYEHMPYALLAKLGVVGALICGLFCAGWAFTAWQVRRIAPAQVASFLGGSTALLVAEMTNPLILNFVSMSILACLLLQWASLAALPDRTEPSSG
jgi:O-Antigen ligase